MKLHRLTAHNVFKFDEIDINFEQDTFLILASTKGDLSQSNGVGKSAILELVFFALFGETIRGILDISKNHTGKFDVSLAFDDKKITRNKSKVKFEMDGAETQVGRKTEMQKMINTIIKMDGEILKYTHIFDSEDTFFQLKDEQKKDVLMKLINLDFLDALHEKLGKVLTDLQDKRHDNTIAIFQEELKDIDTIADKEKIAYEELMVVQEEEGNIRKYIEFKRDLDNKLPRYVDLIASIRSQRGKLRLVKENLAGIKVEESDTDKLQGALQNLIASISKDKSEIAEWDNKRVKLLTTNACPVFDDIICDKLTPEYKAEKVSGIEATIIGLRAGMKVDTDEKVRVEAFIKESNSQKLKYNEMQAEFEGGKAVYNADKERAQKLRDEIRILVDTHKDVRKYKDCKISLQDIRMKQMAYADIQAKYKMMREKQTKLGELIVKNDITKKQISELTIIRKIFGKDGLKQFAVSKIVKFLQTEINNMLSRIFPNMAVNIITDFNVEKKNMLKINIIRNGYESEMKEFSKGERRIFEIIFQIAMYKLFTKFSQESVSVMFFDEVFDPIDDHNKTTVTDILGLLENEDKTIFVISHDKSMKQYFDRVLLVENDGKFEGDIDISNSWIKSTKEAL